MSTPEEQLWEASKSGNVTEVNKLFDPNRFKRPVNVNYRDKKEGKTSLYIATEKGHCDVVLVLLRHKADVNIHANNGWVPLHEAARNRNTRCTNLLIEYGSHVDVLDRQGDTPLMAAAWNGRDDNAEILLQAGARISLRNDAGFSALDWSSQYGHEKVTDLIRRFQDQRTELLNVQQETSLVVEKLRDESKISSNVRQAIQRLGTDQTQLRNRSDNEFSTLLTTDNTVSGLSNQTSQNDTICHYIFYASIFCFAWIVFLGGVVAVIIGFQGKYTLSESSDESMIKTVEIIGRNTCSDEDCIAVHVEFVNGTVQGGCVLKEFAYRPHSTYAIFGDKVWCYL